MDTFVKPLVTGLLLCSLLLHQGDARSLLFTRPLYKTSIEEHFPFQNESISQLVRVEPPIRAQYQGKAAARAAPIRYSILSGNDDGYFRLDPTTGEIILVRQVDRERLATNTEPSGFSLVIQAASADAEPAVARLIVDVRDINDNPPVFHPAQHVISIVENLPVDFNVLRLSASDPDLGENGAFTYRLIDSSGAFNIDPLTGWLSVFNSTALDRERTAQLIIWVVAHEAKPNLLTTNQSSARVDIQLMDANDNSPVFRPSNLYSFSVESNAETGTIIGQVEAKDADLDENGRVSYSIQHPTEGDDKANKVPFSIHPETGHVIVVDTPLTKESYTLLVEASDEPFNPSERRLSLAVVQIAVESINKVDEDDNLPHFVNKPYEFWIGSGAQMDSIVGQVKALGLTEQDVRYSIKHNLRQPVPLGIDPRNGVIRVTDDLKKTSPLTYSLNVTASDGKRETVAGVTVHVLADDLLKGRSVTSSTDRQPSIPRFLFNVTENSPAVTIGHIDYPDRKFLEFIQLEPNAFGWQWLKLARNGSLYCRRPLDFEETGANLTVFVAVRDQGRTIDTIQLVVRVLDVNDNPPVFQHERYVGRISENAAAGTAVRFNRTIKAIDPDGPLWNMTRYSLSGSNSRLFRIDVITGEITVVRTKSLDRERAQSYSLTVTASDGALSSTAQVTILVDDVNDNPPEIAGFVPAITVVALERSPDRQDLQNEGHIVVCADGSCSLPLNLEDGAPSQLPPGGRSLSTYSRFRTHLLRVLDEWIEQAERSVDQIPPDENEILERAFQQILYNSTIFIQVPEDFPINNTIGSFSAMDRDATARLRFSLRDGAHKGVFEVLPGGALVMKRSLRTDQVYSLKVEVSDGQGLASETSVAVQVMDVNNHRPVFQRSFYELILPEGDYDRSPFVTIEATDRDQDENAQLTYSLSNGSHPFDIHPQTGLLLVTGSVDREQVEFYRLTVRVVDKGSPPLKNQADVVVYIADVNDNVPVFDQRLWSVSLPDGTPSGAPVVRVRATDADSDVRMNANVTYRLDSHHDVFGIDTISGAIFTVTTIEMDRGREYNVLVVAEDGGTPSLSVVAVVRVTVEETPCRANSVPKRQQTIVLEENVTTPLVLVNLTVSESLNGSIRLTLVRIEPVSSIAQSLFSLDPIEPVLWLNGSLDRESKGSAYFIHMKVQRSGDDGKNVTCPDVEELIVTIRVLDVNDNPPVFEQDSIVVVVPFDAYIGQEVIALSAKDDDEGLNGMVRYSMTSQSISRSGHTEFTIDPSSGIVSVTSRLDRLFGRIQHYQVKATDRNGKGMSSTMLLSIHILDKSHQVALVLGTNHEELVPHWQNISYMLSDISGMEVWVKSVEPHVSEGDMVDGSMSDIVMYARNHSGHRLVNSEDLSRALNLKREELNNKLSRYRLHEIRTLTANPPSSPSRIEEGMEALEVTLFAIGAAVLLGTIVAVVCIILSRVKLRKRTRLLATSPLSGGRLDYHLQPLRAVPSSVLTTSAGSSSPAGAGNSDMYVEVPNDLGRHLYVPPLASGPGTPCCPVCHRRKKKRCRCTCGKHMNRSTNMHMSRSRLFRSHSDSIHPPSGCCVHPGRPNGKESKQVRLSIPQRSMSVMIEPAVVHLQEDGKHHLHHRRQRSLSPQSLHRHLRSKHPNQAMDQLHSGCSSSGETFEDSLESPRSRRQPSGSNNKR